MFKKKYQENVIARKEQQHLAQIDGSKAIEVQKIFKEMSLHALGLKIKTGKDEKPLASFIQGVQIGITNTDIVMPEDLNSQNVMFGGKIDSAIDKLGAILALQLTGERCATRQKNTAYFSALKNGDIYTVMASLQEFGTTSVKILVTVDNVTENEVLVAQATCVYVALDEKGEPKPIAKKQKKKVSGILEKHQDDQIEFAVEEYLGFVNVNEVNSYYYNEDHALRQPHAILDRGHAYVEIGAFKHAKILIKRTLDLMYFYELTTLKDIYSSIAKGLAFDLVEKDPAQMKDLLKYFVEKDLSEIAMLIACVAIREAYKKGEKQTADELGNFSINEVFTGKGSEIRAAEIAKLVAQLEKEYGQVHDTKMQTAN